MSQSDDSQFKLINQTLLLPIVQRALSSNIVEITTWDYQEVHGGIGGGVGGTAIYRFIGQGREGDEIIPWSLILKVLQPGTDNDPSGSHYWKREAEAYRSGWLDHLPGSLGAPKCFGIDEYQDDIWIWLEDIEDEFGQQWPLERYGLAARHLGRFNGSYLVQGNVPSWSWLSSQWMRKNCTLFASGFAKLRQSLTHPMLRRSLPKNSAEQAIRLWAERELFLTALEGLPHTVCHFDAQRRNLFARRTKAGQDQTIAIDWALVGLGPLGSEISALVLVTLGLRELEANRAVDLDRIVFHSYLDGLHDVGWTGNPRQVRFAFTAETVLSRLCALGQTVDLFIDERLQPDNIELWADHYAQVGLFVDSLADEAKELLPAL